MCLHRIDPEKPPEQGIFYKIFSRDEKGNLHFEYHDHHGVVPVGKWINNPFPTLSIGEPSYPSGFHGLRDIYDAKVWLVSYSVKPIKELWLCEYREAHTAGRQADRVCIVANKILLKKKLLTLRNEEELRAIKLGEKTIYDI